jgi:hypothetical protein
MSDVFSTPEPFQTAVLFLVFNRPDTTKQVFEAIRQAKPPRLYVAADGPRANREGESERVEQVRKIATAVDWPCEVKTLFRNENLGCKKAVSGGIDWFFKNEEQGIILEDDCLPHHDFFHFCETMLIRYRNDKTIGMISGFNPQGSNILSNEYFKSKNHSIWGWATWQNRWKEYDIQMAKWEIHEVRKIIRKKLKFKIYLYYKLSFGLTLEGVLNTWDYQWAFCQIYQNTFTIKPLVNLIKNIGAYGEHAVGEDKNHNTPYGCFEGSCYICNDKMAANQDNSFYKYNLPGVMLILFKYIIFKVGLYQSIKKLIN